MKNKKHRLIASTLIALVLQAFITLVFWAAGYDFNERGEVAVFYVSLSAIPVVVGVACYVAFLGPDILGE
jgi:membrane protease YdiL (CAAX protease family)